MNEEVIQSIILQNPLLQRQREKLEALKPGAYCYHNTFGYGTIERYDEATGRLIIDFENKPHHSIDPAFAAKHVRVLANDHIIAKFHSEPESVKKMLQDDPAAAVRLILKNKEDQRSTQADLILSIESILGEKSAKTWWNKARKAIESDPQIALPESKTGYYILRETPIAPIDEFIEGLANAKSLAKKIEFGNKILESDSTDISYEKIGDLLENMQHLLNMQTVSTVDQLRLFWLLRDLYQRVNYTADTLPPLEDVLLHLGDLTEVANALSVAQLNRFLREMESVFPEDFKNRCIQLIKTGNSRTIGTCVDFLMKAGHSKEIAKIFHQWLNENSFRASGLEWVIHNRKNRKYHELLEGLVNLNTFRMALTLIDQEALKRANNRKVPLADTIANDKDFVKETLDQQPVERARDLAHMLLQSQGFDILTKKSILARFIRIHPSLQKLLSTETQKTAETLKVSQESVDRIRKEYEQLVSEKIPANKIAIEIAREHGDLKENSEYKMARQDQSILLARKEQIEKDLARIQIIDFNEAPTDKVGIGSVVVLQDAKGKLHRIAILGAWDSDPARGIIAYETPLGQKLLGLVAGDQIETEPGKLETIQDIERWCDCQKNW